MGCTHCGQSSVDSTHKLVFNRSDKVLELSLCDDCLAEILSETDIQLSDT